MQTNVVPALAVCIYSKYCTVGTLLRSRYGTASAGVASLCEARTWELTHIYIYIMQRAEQRHKQDAAGDAI